MAYNIIGTNMLSSSVLKTYDATINNNNNQATVNISSKNISELIQKLHQENINITSFSPEISMNKLFEN